MEEATPSLTLIARSYGFRPGRSTHDAQRVLFSKLQKKGKEDNRKNHILELDIEKCFDRINHEAILERIIAPKYVHNGLLRCLKSGTNPQFPQQGTPQGGVSALRSVHR